MQRVRTESVVVALAWLLGACSPGREANERIEVDSTAREERVVIDGVDYRLALDELGLVVEPHLEGEAALLDAMAGEKALVFTAQHWVLSVRAGTRGELVQLAIEAERLQPEFVRAAGLVLRRAGSDTPLILGGQLVVTFERGVPDERARALITARGGLVSYRRRRDPSTYAVHVDVDAPSAGALDALRLADALRALDEVRRAEVVLIVPVADYGAFLTDPLLDRQWHHHNDVAITGGTADADVDTLEAWKLTTGDPGVVVAIVDRGVELDHEDLAGNRWTNPGETVNGDDGDGNGIDDDVHGASFEPPKPSAVFTAHPHGTSVAGLAGAVKDNSFGGAGTCPTCPLMFVERGQTPMDHAEAVDYAVGEGADVINLSWGYAGDFPLSTFFSQALDDAAQAGVVVVAAMSNSAIKDDCQTSFESIPAHSAVIAVSGSDHNDRSANLSYGLCTDVLAPAGGIDFAAGVLVGIGTTDLQGPAGYNDDLSQSLCADVNDQSFTVCFKDNSAAAPIVAGIAGLVLSAAPGLSPDKLENLLRDTADRIEHSKASYRTSDGRGEVVVAGATTSKHGSGRVNAFEAVRVVAPVSLGGRGGVDVFLRDNHLDWGNTERPSNHRFEPGGAFIGHWKSVDIKVDAPPYELSLQATSAEFEAFQHENPRSLVTNRVFVRVRNRGPSTAAGVTVRLLRAFAGAGLPVLPSDFAGPGTPSASSWTYLGEQPVGALVYSGSTLAGGHGDPAAVVSFDFVGPLVGTGQPDSRHYCLLAVVESSVDKVSFPSLVPDQLTPNDNNVTHRNVQVVPLEVSPSSSLWNTEFLVRNPFPEPRTFRLRIEAPPAMVALDLSRLGLGALVSGRISPSFELASRAEVLVSARTTWPADVFGDVDFIQEQLLDVDAPGPQKETWEPLGGWTLRRGR